jgi:predicted O-methyltransferase YrrM
MKNLPQRILYKVPGLGRRIARAIDLSIADISSPQAALPGHYYSPIPDLAEIKQDENRIFHSHSKEIPGIELNEVEQIHLLKEFIAYYNRQPFSAEKRHGLRYYFENSMYLYSDAIFLFCMMLHTKPRKVVEVGSGYSSCLMLDTNDLFLNRSVQLTFIEPFPERLLSVLKPGEIEQVNLVRKRVQDVSLELFTDLSAGDILFIDSSHISKTGSDINYIVFEVLPRLNSGVYVHFHDIYYPFEYPKSLVYTGYTFNEAYVLRAFLTFNMKFKIVLFNTFLEEFHLDFFEENMPLCLINKGASLWIMKL